MKFRVYDNVDKKYIPEEHARNNFYLDIDGKVVKYSHVLGCMETGNHYTVEFSTNAFEFDENKKYGEEIFQGDVIRCDCFESHEIYDVMIENFKRLPDEMIGSKCNSRKIIGNIHGGSDER